MQSVRILPRAASTTESGVAEPVASSSGPSSFASLTTDVATFTQRATALAATCSTSGVRPIRRYRYNIRGVLQLV